MNKQGHVAVGVAVAAAVYTWQAQAQGTQELLPAWFLTGAALGSLLPDLDHKTSTASNWIQPSVRMRRWMQATGGTLIVLALVFQVLVYLGIVTDEVSPMLLRVSWVIGGVGVLGIGFAKLRLLVLIGLGMYFLQAWWLGGAHWIVAVTGAALVITPFVKHRGIVHTPEFALLLSVGWLLFSNEQGEAIQSLVVGIVIGWWVHLLGDIFGSEGIHSLLLPRLQVRLRLFANGGRVERWITHCCATLSLLLLLWSEIPSTISG